MSCKLVRLGDVINVQNGYAFKSAEYADSGYFLLRITNVQNGYISNNNPKYVSITDSSNLSQFILDEGDILMSLTGNVGRVGIIKLNNIPAVLNQRVARIKIKSTKIIDKKYLFWFLNNDNTRRKIEKLGDGVAQINVSTKEIELIEIPLPPLAEQKRIADILDKANEIKDKRELALAKLNELAECTFTEMFGDFETNTKKLPVELLSSLVTVQGGYAFNSNDYMPTGIRLVKISNVHKDNLIWDEDDFLPNEYLKKFSDYELRCNDIVIALTRPIIKSLNSVKVAIVNQSDLPCLLNQRVARFIFKNEVKLNATFFRALLATKFFYNLVNKLCSTALQPNISTKQIESICIPLPPLSEQQRFETIIKELETIKLSMTNSHNLSTRNLLSLQNQAFTNGFNA